jgi:hypothetical protein
MKDGQTPPLRLRVGDLVEVRSEQEILATLDEQGTLDGMPFMPEMLEYCGKHLRVDKRADKTCNTITVMESRRIYDAVHLEGLRCSGDAHGGCQAQCFLYWKEAWLKRIGKVKADSARSPASCRPAHSSLRCDRERLSALTRRPESSNGSGIAYSCQATDLLKASEPLPWWDIRQYLRDVWSGNVGVMDLVKASLFAIFQKTLRITAYRAQLRSYNCFQSWRGGTPYPYLWGTLDKTPRETLDLQPGELVQVKSYEEILKTLNKRNRNRGLFFGPEMVPYCGSQRRVRARVEHIIDERTGKMLTLPGECIILEGAICGSRYSERRLFCPRSLFPFWREIWLKRPEETAGPQASPGRSLAAQIREKE